jgi:two-component system, response regulator
MSTGAASSANILVVDDNPQDLELTLRALRKAGIDQRLQVARDGAEVLALVLEGTCRPHLILLDLKLPKFDGIEVLQRLKADPRTAIIPVVVLTSSREKRDIIESYRLGVNSYIVKPVEFERFAAAVREIGHYWLGLNQSPHIG